MLRQIALGLLLSASIGYLGYRRRSLSRSGVAGAILTGTALFGLGGLPAGVLLIAFFVSSSALSHYQAQRKTIVAEEFSKGSQRDIVQTLANGGVAALAAVLYAAVPAGWVWAALVGALAAANADTWATELGVLSRQPPRLIINGRIVAVGTSGAVTLRGTLAALAAAALIAGLAALFAVFDQGVTWALRLLLVGSLSGLAGSMFDSLLGATVQAVYYCDSCEKETERHPLHRCGTPTYQLRGRQWLNNDVVNFAATLVGALLGAGLWLLLN